MDIAQRPFAWWSQGTNYRSTLLWSMKPSRSFVYFVYFVCLVVIDGGVVGLAKGPLVLSLQRKLPGVVVFESPRYCFAERSCQYLR